MDFIQKSVSKSTKFLSQDGRDDQDDDFKSDATSNNDPIDFNDMLGNPEVETRSNNVSKGRAYLIFTIVMCCLLSFMVVQKNQSVGTVVNTPDATSE